MNEITSSEDVRLILLSNFQTRSMRAPATIFKDVFLICVNYVNRFKIETYPFIINEFCIVLTHRQLEGLIFSLTKYQQQSKIILSVI